MYFLFFYVEPIFYIKRGNFFPITRTKKQLHTGENAKEVIGNERIEKEKTKRQKKQISTERHEYMKVDRKNRIQ